jgi:hypothetical protein
MVAKLEAFDKQKFESFIWQKMDKALDNLPL